MLVTTACSLLNMKLVAFIVCLQGHIKYLFNIMVYEGKSPAVNFNSVLLFLKPKSEML